MTYRARQPDLFQEEDRVPRRGVFAFLAMVAVVSAVLVTWTVSLVDGRYRALRPSGAFPERHLGPRRMVARVRQDLFDEQRRVESLNAQKRRELSTYGWVDRDRGVARIPIEEAMDLVAGGLKP